MNTRDWIVVIYANSIATVTGRPNEKQLKEFYSFFCVMNVKFKEKFKGKKHPMDSYMSSGLLLKCLKNPTLLFNLVRNAK